MTTELIEIAEDSTKGSFILVGGTVIATAISALTSIFIARFLGPENYGLYSLSLVVPQILFLITDFGIGEGIIKFSIEARAKKQTNLGIKLIKYCLLIRIVASLILFIILFMLSDQVAEIIFQRPELGFFIKISSVTVVFHSLYLTSVYAYIGFDKTVHSSLITQIQSVAKALSSIILLLLGFSILGAVIGYVLGFMIGGIVGIISLLAYFKKHNKTVNSEQITHNLKKLITYGAPLYFSILMIGFMPQYMDILSALFVSNLNIGNFKATSNFMILLTIVAQQVTTALLPSFTKLNNASIKERNSFFNASHKFTTLVTIPLTFLMIIFSNEIVQLAYGSTFTNAGFYLAIYSFIYILTGIGYLNIPSLFNGTGKTIETLKMNIITFLIVLTISPITTSSYGIVGLILTLLFAQTIGSLYGVYRAKKTLNLSIDKKNIPKIYLIAVLSIIPTVLVAANFTSIPKMAIGAIIYLFSYITLIPLTNIINEKENELLTRSVEKIKILSIIKPVLKYQNKISKLTKKDKKIN